MLVQAVQADKRPTFLGFNGMCNVRFIGSSFMASSENTTTKPLVEERLDFDDDTLKGEKKKRKKSFISTL